MILQNTRDDEVSQFRYPPHPGDRDSVNFYYGYLPPVFGQKP